MTTCQPVMPRPPGNVAELAEPGHCLIWVDVGNVGLIIVFYFILLNLHLNMNVLVFVLI